MDENKKKVIAGLIEKGKAAGKLSTSDIDMAIIETELRRLQRRRKTRPWTTRSRCTSRKSDAFRC